MNRSKCDTVQRGDVARFLMAISVNSKCCGCGLICSSTPSLLPDSLDGGETDSSAMEGKVAKVKSKVHAQNKSNTAFSLFHCLYTDLLVLPPFVFSPLALRCSLYLPPWRVFLPSSCDDEEALLSC